jgi:hypothetical protein
MSYRAVPHISAGLFGSCSADLLMLARTADQLGMHVWIGPNPWDPSEWLTDSFTTTLAAAVATTTERGRIGVVLDCGEPDPPLRLAEDLAVIDQASGGRLRVALLHPSVGEPSPATLVEQLTTAWSAWPAGDVHVVCTPPPMQPDLPFHVLTPGAAFSTGGMEWIPIRGMCSELASPGRVPDARALIVKAEVVEADDDSRLLAVVKSIRQTADLTGATELIVDLNSIHPSQRPARLSLTATVMVPALRCSAHQLDVLFADALDWWKMNSPEVAGADL